MRKTICIWLSLLCCLSACTVRPHGVLSKKRMAAVLYDLHRADGILQVAGYTYGSEQEAAMYYEAVLQKHGVTQAQFDSSLVWYTDHPKQFRAVYPRITERLKTEKEELTRINGQRFVVKNKEPEQVRRLNTDSLLQVVRCGLHNDWDKPVQTDSLPADSLLLYFVLPEYRDSVRCANVVAVETTECDTVSDAAAAFAGKEVKL